MGFPANPTNGQQTTVNGVIWSYDNTKDAWSKISTGSTTIPAALSTSLTVTGNITATDHNMAQANIRALRLISNIADGNAPLIVNSTTQVANLNVAVSGTVATAAQPNITSVGNLTIANVDNIQLDSNTISTLNTNGNLTLAPNGTGLVLTNNIAAVGSNTLICSSNLRVNTGSGNINLFNNFISHANVMSANTIIPAGMNAQAIGPLEIADTYVLDVQGELSII